MGRKNVLKSYNMFEESDANPNGGDMSAPIVSNTTSVINQDNASIHITWSGSSPVGEKWTLDPKRYHCTDSNRESPAP